MLKFLRDFLIYGFASILSKVVGVFLMPIYTSILTREEYGVMAMLASTAGIIDLISNFNIHSGIARDYYEEGVDRKLLVSTGFWSILSLSVFIMGFLLLSRSFWLETVLEIESSYELCFVFVLMGMPLSSLTSYFSILTRFKKKPILFSLGITIQLIIQLSIAIYTIVFLKIGILGFFLATFVANAFAFFYFARLNKEFITLKFKRSYLHKALLFSIPTLPAIVAGWLDSSLGQILVGKYVSLTDLGVYSIALQMASVFTLLGVALQNVWSPFLYENYTKENFVNQVKKMFLLFIILLTVVTSSLSLFSREIVLLLSNPNYLEAGKYFTLLCIPMGIYILFPFASSGVSISRETKYIGISYVLGSIVNVACLLIFLPKLGVVCVPIGLAVSRAVTYSILYIITKKKNLLVLPNRYLLLFVVLCAGCFAACEQNLLIRVISFISVNACLAFVFFNVFSMQPIIAFIKKKIGK